MQPISLLLMDIFLSQFYGLHSLTSGYGQDMGSISPQTEKVKLISAMKILHFYIVWALVQTEISGNESGKCLWLTGCSDIEPKAINSVKNKIKNVVVTLSYKEFFSLFVITIVVLQQMGPVHGSALELITPASHLMFFEHIWLYGKF